MTGDCHSSSVRGRGGKFSRATLLDPGIFMISKIVDMQTIYAIPGEFSEVMTMARYLLLIPTDFFL
jgi:hypothetical protein